MIPNSKKEKCQKKKKKKRRDTKICSKLGYYTLEIGISPKKIPQDLQFKGFGSCAMSYPDPQTPIPKRSGALEGLFRIALLSNGSAGPPWRGGRLSQSTGSGGRGAVAVASLSAHSHGGGHGPGHVFRATACGCASRWSLCYGKGLAASLGCGMNLGARQLCVGCYWPATAYVMRLPPVCRKKSFC